MISTRLFSHARANAAAMIYYGTVGLDSSPESEESVMDVGSISSSSNAALAASVQSQLRARQSEQDQSAQPTPQSQQTQQAQQSQQNQGSSQAQGTAPVDERESASRAQAEASRPTVNTSGQTVGTRINTTA
jgi:hypothetical protein